MKAKILILTFLLPAFLMANAQPTPDRGFIHPGGLHTQADFDRAKAQIAAGNTKVKQAFAKLKAAGYAQPSVQTFPTEVIVRGGGSGENYMNACRGAAMAYGNALRWKLEGNKACANAAVRVLMAWANTTKSIGGDTNYALAAGLYGYQFAQAAELMRDYEGWQREDFAQFQRWMLEVWYPSSLGFLRGRNGTWENSGKWWQAPGHYWSNWGLCNALCLVSIGVLCDDVFIYNQGMSYFKYDQVGTFADPPTLHEVTGHGEADGGKCIHNDGLTEFLGNLVVTTSQVQGSKFKVQDGTEMEVGAYGEMGQLNESGRDAGHSSMSLGLAVDLAKIGWNQGDDLFAYMNHRLAAGIEFLAAQTQSVANLPWTDYMYGTNGIYYTDGRAWLMTEPALGAQMRPYWGTVIGIYEGVKGVAMPFAEVSYNNMGIDEGGQGGTSGGYDHLGYSVLMNTRDEQLCPAEKVPTELSPKMEYSATPTASLIPSLNQEKNRKLVVGKTIYHNELGGLVNTYSVNNNTTLPAGKTIVLMPQLPEGEEDTGRWLWNTGEQTRDITVSTERSFIYRVTYTNKNGIESQLSFAIAAEGDCTADRLTPVVTYNGATVPVGSSDGKTTPISVLYGKSVTLAAKPSAGWGTYKWSTKAATESITKSITTDQEISVEFKNQGGAVSTQTFDIRMVAAEPYTKIGDAEAAATTAPIVAAGSSVTLGLTLPTAVRAANVAWNDGSTGATLTLDNVQTSASYSATFTLRDKEYTFTFDILVKAAEASLIETGDYLIRHIASNTYLTASAMGQLATFLPREQQNPSQVWLVERNSRTTYNLTSTIEGDSIRLNSSAKVAASAYFPFYLEQPVGTDRLAIRTGATASSYKYWNLDDDGTLLTSAATVLEGFPFQLIPYTTDGVRDLTKEENEATEGRTSVYDLSGRSVRRQATSTAASAAHLLITNGKKILLK